MAGKLLFERDGGVVTLTLDSPDTRNAVTDLDIVDEMVDACGRIQRDVTVGAVILTGAGEAFSSGDNIKHMRDKQGSFGGDVIAVREKYKPGIQRLILALYNLEAPTIAAVNGPAYGAGCDIAFACDIRVASERAVFAENFVKVGIISGDGGSWLLPRTIGMSRACELSFTGDAVGAVDALAWGMVSRLAPHGELMDEAMTLARRIAANPVRALRLQKRLLREGQTVRFETLSELAAAFQGACHQTADHEEAVKAILEKRAAVFTGT